MRKIFITAGIILIGAAVVAATIFPLYRLTDKRSPLKAVDFAASYESITEEDKLTESAYATLMDEVFEKMKKTDAPDVNREKPDISFVCHDGNGENIKSYRIFRISARNRDYVIYSADEDTFYKVDTDTLDTFFDMPPVKEACLDAEIPSLILKTTVSEGPRALGTTADGIWNYADATGNFSAVTVTKAEAEDVVDLDFGLYDFCFICTKTPDKLTLCAEDDAGGARTETEITVGKRIPSLEKGRTYTLTLKAEWEKKESKDFYGTVSYVFNVKTTD